MSAAPHYVPSPTPDLARIERALISVSDKEGLVELGKALAGHGVEILSTGGSAKALRDAGLTVVEAREAVIAAKNSPSRLPFSTRISLSGSTGRGRSNRVVSQLAAARRNGSMPLAIG